MDLQDKRKQIPSLLQKKPGFPKDIEEATRAINKLQSKAILLVGLSKSGLTTTFNWLTNKKMIGKGNLNFHYINLDPSNPAINKNRGQQTIIPNIECKFEDNWSLIDMGAFPQSENGNDLYDSIRQHFWTLIFKKIKQIRIALVIPQRCFCEQHYQTFLSSFKELLDVFKFESNEWESEQIQQFQQSIGLVITRSHKSYQQHYGYLCQVIQEIKQQNVSLRKITASILQKIRDGTRMYSWKNLKNDEYPKQNSDLIDLLLSRRVRIESFKTPKSLTEVDPQNQKLSDMLVQKLRKMKIKLTKQQPLLEIKKIQEFPSIISTLFQNFLKLLEDNINQVKFNSKKIQTGTFFAIVQKWLQEKGINIRAKEQTDILTQSLVRQFKTLLRLRDLIIQKNKQLSQEFDDPLRIQLVQCTMKQIFNYLGVFSQTDSHVYILYQLEKNITTSFEYLSDEYLTEHCMIEDVFLPLLNNLKAIFSNNFGSQWQLEVLSKFVKQIDQKLLTYDCKTLQNAVLLEQMLQSYKPQLILKNCSSYKPPQLNIHFKIFQLYFSMNEADLVLKEGSNLQSIILHIKSFKITRQLKKMIILQNYESSKIQWQGQQLYRVEEWQQRIFNKIYQALVQTSDSLPSPIGMHAPITPDKYNWLSWEINKWKDSKEALHKVIKIFKFKNQEMMTNLLLIEKLIFLGQLYIQQYQHRNQSHCSREKEIEVILVEMQKLVEEEVLKFDREGCNNQIQRIRKSD